MPWWKRKIAKENDGQSHIPSQPSTSVQVPVTQILNQLSPPVSWESETAEHGRPIPMSVLKCLLLMGEGKKKKLKAVMEFGWVLLMALRNVW